MNLSRIAIASILVLAPLAASAQQSEIRVQVPGVDRPILLDSVAIAIDVNAPADNLVKAINEVYAEWGLSVDSFDPAVGRFPNRRLNIRRQFRGKLLSLYLDCGTGFAGKNADTYRVTLATAAWPSPPTGEATKLHVAIVGGGLDPAGNKNAYVYCTTTGRFEREFAERVKAKLGS